MDKVVDKLVGLGVAGLVLLFVIWSVGLPGAAAIVAALALLGGPFGMLGGIAVFGIMSLVASAITKYGIEKLAPAVVKGLLDEGQSKESLKCSVNKIPDFIISKDLKRKIIRYINEN